MKLVLSVAVLCAVGRLAAADGPVAAKPSGTNAPAPARSGAAATAAALRSFRVKPGFRVDLVASEPLVTQPVAMAFDENGRLFVLEKPDDPAVGGLPFSRVRVLEDADGDGVYDASGVYADNLTNATALVCYGGGVFVAAAGRILYLKDSKADGTADEQREVFKSFGDATNGQRGQVIITGLAWGPDNRIHASTAGRGGDVISGSSPNQSVILTGGNFSFDPRTSLLSVESGSAAAGLGFDSRGRAFISSLRGHLEMIMYEARYAARNPYCEPPPAMQDLESPAELAARAGASALSPGTNSANNLFAIGRGLAIYQGTAFPADYGGDAFVADVAGNGVHHLKLRPQGVQFSAEQPADESGAEFLAVNDNSFQSMQVANAPDGALYFAGRGLPVMAPGRAARTNTIMGGSLPRGGIYRLSPVNFKPAKPPLLGKATADQLVLSLRHPNGWQRDTAARLLYERQDRTAIVPLIRLLFDAQAPPLGRMHALLALDGIQVTAEGRPGKPLMEPHVLRGLSDPDDRVRETAVLLAERFITPAGAVSDNLWGALAGLAGDPSPQVRYQLAFTLGQARHDGRAQILAQMVREDPGNRWLQWAALSSLREGAGEMFGLVAGDANLRSSPDGEEFLRQLVAIAGAKNQPAEIAPVLAALPGIPDARIAFDLVRTLDNSLQTLDVSLTTVDTGGALNPLYARARAVAVDMTADDAARVSALRLLNTRPIDIDSEPGVITALTQEWFSLRPAVRNEVLSFLLSRPTRTAILIYALGNSMVPRTDLSSTQTKFLLAHPDASIQVRAVALFQGVTGGPRQMVVNRYLSALQLVGGVEHGREIFAAQCAACHQFAGQGKSFGLPLTDEALADREKVLIKILDPNREPPARHPEMLVITKSGETLTGFVASEGSKNLTLCDDSGQERVLGHSQIASVSKLGFSVMSEGLESVLNQQAMADLLEYLCGQGAKANPQMNADARR